MEISKGRKCHVECNWILFDTFYVLLVGRLLLFMTMTRNPQSTKWQKMKIPSTVQSFVIWCAMNGCLTPQSTSSVRSIWVSKCMPPSFTYISICSLGKGRLMKKMKNFHRSKSPPSTHGMHRSQLVLANHDMATAELGLCLPPRGSCWCRSRGILA